MGEERVDAPPTRAPAGVVGVDPDQDAEAVGGRAARRGREAVHAVALVGVAAVQHLQVLAVEVFEALGVCPLQPQLGQLAGEVADPQLAVALMAAGGTARPAAVGHPPPPVLQHPVVAAGHRAGPHHQRQRRSGVGAADVSHPPPVPGAERARSSAVVALEAVLRLRMQGIRGLRVDGAPPQRVAGAAGGPVADQRTVVGVDLEAPVAGAQADDLAGAGRRGRGQTDRQGGEQQGEGVAEPHPLSLRQPAGGFASPGRRHRRPQWFENDSHRD